MRNSGYTAAEAIMVMLVIIAVGISGYFLFDRQHKATNSPPIIDSSTSQTNKTASPYATLPPATVPSKTAECSQQVIYASNGVPGPVQCANGNLNADDWQALAALEPKVLTLGYGVSIQQVQSTLCSDVKANISNPIEQTVYQIASLYYGWNFNPSPALILNSSNCQNVDD
ncbi:MAG: hypothetical protein ACYCPS_04000 [Candidatus Saccharimonadales bacterium]